MSTYTYVLHGQLPGGKNAIGVTRTGRHYPNARFVAWRTEAIRQMRTVGLPPKPIDVPISLVCRYTPGDLRTRDVTGMLDALFSILVTAGVVTNDGLIHDVLWTRTAMRRAGPSVILQVEAL